MDLGRERGSIILTPNKSYVEWGSIFGDFIMATVVLDPLLHHFSAISICEKSCRLEKRRRVGPDPLPDQQHDEPTALAHHIRTKRYKFSWVL